ncbi:MAG: TonB-dependent receptor, partial [Gammaproteobacteria bacterium]
GQNRPGQERSEDRVTYMFTLQYDISDNVMAYATYGTGSKSGGFNANPVNQNIPLEFQEEKSDTIEAGIKSTFLEGRAMLNLNVYQMDVDGVQTTTINPNATGFIVGNAGDRRSRGVELELALKPIEALTLRGSFAYLDAEYTSYKNGSCPVVNPGIPAGSRPGTCNFSGYRPFHSPKTTASLAADYSAPLGQGLAAFAGVDVSFTGKLNTVESLDPRGDEDATTLLAARFGVETEDGRWRVTAFGRNLTDEKYYTASTNLILNSLMSAAAPGATPPGAFAGAGGYVGWYAPPRTYGIEVSFSY